MKKLLLVFLLLTPNLWASWGSAGSLFNGNQNSSASTWTVNFSAQCDAGNMCVCVIAADNDGDGIANDINLITDGLHTWNEAAELEYDPGAANAGASVSIQWVLATSNITTGTNVNVNLATARTAKGMVCHEFTLTAGGTVTKVCNSSGLTGTSSNNAGGECTPSSGSREHLYILGAAAEMNTDGCTAGGTGATVAFTCTDNATTGGGSAANMGAAAVYLINTSTSSGVVGGSLGVTWGASGDYAAIQAGFDEDAGGGGGGSTYPGWWGSGVGF